MRKLSIIALSIMMSYSFFTVHAQEPGFRLTETNIENSENSLRVTPTAVSLRMYESIQLKTEVKTAASQYTVVYAVENPDVATISNSGFISAKGVGTTNVKVSVELEARNYEVVVVVSVQQAQTTIAFNDKEMHVNRGQTVNLPYTTSNPNIQNKDIVWESSNPTVATVIDGNIKALKTGKTTISASVGTQKATILVNVWVALNKIEFNPQTIVIHMGDTPSVPSLIYVPFDATVARKPVFTPANKDIVEVIDGKIIPKSLGTTSLVATIGSSSATLSVEVKPRENEYGASVVTMRPYTSTPDLQIFDVDRKLLTSSNLFALSLPSDETKAAIAQEKAIDVMVPSELLANNAKRLERLSVPLEVMETLSDKPLILNVKNSKNETLITYTIVSPSSSALNLKFSVHKIASSSELGAKVDGPAYELKFEQGHFPKGSTVTLPSNTFNANPYTLHFVYAFNAAMNVDDSKFEIVGGAEDALVFPVYENRYLITFNALSKSNDQMAIMALGIVVGTILVGGITMMALKRGKRS